MGIKRHTPEEIVAKLRQVEVLVGQGIARNDAIRQISIARISRSSAAYRAKLFRGGWCDGNKEPLGGNSVDCLDWM